MSATTNNPPDTGDSPRFMNGISDPELLALTSAQKGFITSIRLLEQQQELSGDALKAAVADMYPPPPYFHKTFVTCQ